MGRMSVGRFPNRAAALDYLVEKYGRKDAPAEYKIFERDTSLVTFTFVKDFGQGRQGPVSYTGNGPDLTTAIAALFVQLGDEAALTEET
jgi:hypothetical protein